MLFTDSILVNPLSPTLSGHQQVEELANDIFGTDTDEVKLDKTMVSAPQKNHSYVSQSAVALRCRVMPPPCIKNPYLMGSSEMDIDPFGNQRSKCAGTILVFRGPLQETFEKFSIHFSCLLKVGESDWQKILKDSSA